MDILVCLGIATQLITSNSYNFVPVILALAVLWKLLITSFARARFYLNDINSLTKEQQYQKRWIRIISILLIVYFAIFVIYRYAMHGHNSEMDNPSRVLLFLPLIWWPYVTNLSRMLDRIFIGSASGAFIASIVASYGKWILHAERAFPAPYMYIQAGDVSMSLGLFSFVGLFWFLYHKSHVKMLLMMFGFFCGIYASVISASRGGWIILFPVLFGVIVLYRQLIGKRLVAIIFGIIALGTVLVIAVPQFGVLERYNEAISNIEAYNSRSSYNSDTSLGLRFEMWKSAWIAIKERPIIGWGKEGMQAKKEELIDQHIVSSQIRDFNHVHNQYLNDWAERGIFGLLSLLSIQLVPLFIFFNYIKSKSVDSPQSVIAVLGTIHVLGVITYGLSQGFLAHNSGNMFYFFLLALFLGLLLYNDKK